MGLRLNIGSGQRPFKKPFINVDKQARWEPDVIWDAGNPLSLCPFEPGTCDLIVLHHVLEHFGCNEGDSLLRTCHSLLVKGGRLLVFVPDMGELAHMWIEGRLSTQVYMTNVYGAYMGGEADRHKWGYTSPSLIRTMALSGFRGHLHFDGRAIEGADIAKDRWILGVEGIK